MTVKIIKKINGCSNIKKLKQEFKLFFGKFPNACVMCDCNGAIVEFNNHFVKLMQDNGEKVKNLSIFELLQSDQSDITSTYLNKMINGETTVITSSLSVDGKNINNVDVTLIPIIKIRNFIGMYAIFINCTEYAQKENSCSIREIDDADYKIELEKKLLYISTYDELTQLPNRTYFNSQIEYQCNDAIKKDYSFALMILNIDGFKYINDAIGYELADQLLIQVTQRLKNFLGEKQFLSRYSGIRFAIIATEANNTDEYEHLAGSLLKLFNKPFKIDKFELYLTASIGISIFPKDAQDCDSLKKYASIALSFSKRQGKNRYEFHSPDMKITSYKQFMLRTDLRKAIENNQIKIYYQPKVDLKTYNIVSAEALLRWEHPNWGIIMPDEFIPIAEETGLIIDLGNWILKEVCHTYKQWIKDKMPTIKISINYSLVQFLENNFIKNIKNTIKEFELNPDFLIIEITESMLINDYEQIISHIKKLKSMGIQIALDDFGTGFSSLEYLNKFKLDMLKIDCSFIKNIPTDQTSKLITKFIINLAQELDINVVAEGIETFEQLSYLQSINCPMGQGYIFSKAVPSKDFVKVLADKKCTPEGANNINDMEKTSSYEEKRSYFRVEFSKPLETEMTILEINKQKVNVGNAKVLIKDMGPGGLCFVSNILFPIKKDIILQFTTELLGQKSNCMVLLSGLKKLNINYIDTVLNLQ